MNIPFFDLQECLGFLTITANRLLCASLRREMLKAGIDLTAEQWGVLAQLWNREGLSQDELALVACVDKSSMSRVLTAMEAKGLVTREADPANARRKLVRPTAQAQGMKELAREVTWSVLDLALSGVSEQDRAVCLDVLARVKRTLMESGI